MDVKPPLYLLTGEIGAGKTTFCRQLALQARSCGWQAAGLLSPARMENGKKTGILLEDIGSREQRLLAIDPLASPGGKDKSVFSFAVGKWRFDPQVLQWGNAVLANCSPCNLLIVDELGPLEFNHGQGLSAAFELLSVGQYWVSCVVIRPALLEVARARWPWSKALPVAEANLRDLV